MATREEENKVEADSGGSIMGGLGSVWRRPGDPCDVGRINWVPCLPGHMVGDQRLANRRRCVYLSVSETMGFDRILNRTAHDGYIPLARELLKLTKISN